MTISNMRDISNSVSAMHPFEFRPSAEIEEGLAMAKTPRGPPPLIRSAPIARLAAARCRCRCRAVSADAAADVAVVCRLTNMRQAATQSGWGVTVDEFVQVADACLRSRLR